LLRSGNITAACNQLAGYGAVVRIAGAGYSRRKKNSFAWMVCDERRSARQHHRFPDPAGGRSWGCSRYRYESSSRADAAEVKPTAEDAAIRPAAITSNVLQTVSIFNTISQAAKDEKQQNTEQSSDRVAEKGC
jgi:hypothetical protein